MTDLPNPTLETGDAVVVRDAASMEELGMGLVIHAYYGLHPHLKSNQDRWWYRILWLENGAKAHYSDQDLRNMSIKLMAKGS